MEATLDDDHAGLIDTASSSAQVDLLVTMAYWFITFDLLRTNENET